MNKKRIEALRKIYECKDPSKKVVLVKGKKINESGELTRSPYKDKIGAHFDYSGDFEFLDVVAKIIERTIDIYEDQDDDSKDINEAIYDALDTALIYYSDQWKVLKHYLNPQDANWDEAIELFTNDLFELASDIIEEDDTDESLKEAEEVDVYKDVDFKKISDKGGRDDRDLWAIVYDEIFKTGNKSRNYYASEEDYESASSDYESSDHYFNPKKREHTKNLKVLDNNEGIGIGHAKNIDRIKNIADKFKLKYILGKTGDAIIVLIPDEFIEDHKGSLRYIKDIGLKTFRSDNKKEDEEE